MADELEIYNKLIRGYATIVRCAMGTQPMSNITDAHRALFFQPSFVKSKRKSSGGIDVDLSGSALWRLVTIAMNDVQFGKAFVLESYLAYLFCCERFLRGIGTDHASTLGDYLRWLLSWNESVWERRAQGSFGGLQWSLVMNEFGAGLPWEMAMAPKGAAPKSTTLTLSPKQYMPIASFFHPTAFVPTSQLLKSKDDDRSVARPWDAWTTLGVRSLEDSSWYPATIGNVHPSTGSKTPTLWDFRGKHIEGMLLEYGYLSNQLRSAYRFEGSSFKDCVFVDSGVRKVSFKGSSLKNVRFRSTMGAHRVTEWFGVNLTKSTFDGVVFNGLQMSGVSFSGDGEDASKFNDCSFHECRLTTGDGDNRSRDLPSLLSGAEFLNTDFYYTMFECVMNNARFGPVYGAPCRFAHCNFGHVDMQGALFYRSEFKECNFDWISQHDISLYRQLGSKEFVRMGLVFYPNRGETHNVRIESSSFRSCVVGAPLGDPSGTRVPLDKPLLSLLFEMPIDPDRGYSESIERRNISIYE